MTTINTYYTVPTYSGGARIFINKHRPNDSYLNPDLHPTFRFLCMWGGWDVDAGTHVGYEFNSMNTVNMLVERLRLSDWQEGAPAE